MKQVYTRHHSYILSATVTNLAAYIQEAINLNFEVIIIIIAKKLKDGICAWLTRKECSCLYTFKILHTSCRIFRKLFFINVICIIHTYTHIQS